MKKTLITCLMAIVMGFTAFVGCKEEDSSLDNSSNTQTTLEGTLHDFTMSETDEYMVRNGRTEYALVLSETANSFERTGRDEFVTLFKQATGINIRVLQESGEGFTHSENTKYISLGNTKLLQSSGLEIDYDELGSQGVRIITKDKSVYLVGGGYQGALYAVYDFMQLMFNFEAYYHDCWVIDEEVENLKLYNFDVTDVPDVEMRCTGWGPLMKNYNNVAYRFRMPYDYVNYLLPVGDVEHGEARQVIHNISELLPKAYGRTEWYQDGGTQLCFTAHGNAEAYDEMVDRLAYVIEQCLMFYPRESYPNYNAATISIEDSADVCSCASCLEAKSKYGANSGAVIVLCNKVMEKLSAWMSLPENEPYAREDFNLLFLAYWAYGESPTHYDEAQGKYVVNHPDCTMLDNVGAFYCVDENFSTYFDVYHETGKKGRDVAGGWFDIAPVIYLYTYTSNMHEYLGMFNQSSSDYKVITGCYALGDDIVDTEFTYGETIMATSVTNWYTYGFGGTFDGKGHYITYTCGQYGLFGQFAPGAVVKNVAFNDVALEVAANKAGLLLARGLNLGYLTVANSGYNGYNDICVSISNVYISVGASWFDRYAERGTGAQDINKDGDKEDIVDGIYEEAIGAGEYATHVKGRTNATGILPGPCSSIDYKNVIIQINAPDTYTYAPDLFREGYYKKDGASKAGFENVYVIGKSVGPLVNEGLGIVGKSAVENTTNFYSWYAGNAYYWNPPTTVGFYTDATAWKTAVSDLATKFTSSYWTMQDGVPVWSALAK